jgi:hypothetical protein
MAYIKVGVTGILEFHVDTFWGHLQLTALGDLDRFSRPVALPRLSSLNLLYHVVTLEDLAENDVLAVEPAVVLLIFDVFRARILVERSYEVMTVVMKNWEPLVSFPALAIDKRPFLECFSLKFSSAKRSP